MSVRVSAVVVNYGQRELLRACLESLFVSLRLVDGEHEVIVVDNGSADGSKAMVRGTFPGVHLIELEHNVGFAGGMSVGVPRATGEWVLAVNNDATVDPGAVEELL